MFHSSRKHTQEESKGLGTIQADIAKLTGETKDGLQRLNAVNSLHYLALALKRTVALTSHAETSTNHRDHADTDTKTKHNTARDLVLD